ncbi:hypothetical protein TNCV_651431 [Trichonephila clavipes]|nr:hypothetical protein TNCV_651431 [Trichonephila clavipes]
MRCAPQVMMYCERYSLQQLREDLLKKNNVYFGSLKRSVSICLSLYSFGHSPHLSRRPPDGYSFCDFYRLSGVCDPMFYGDLLSSCCLLLHC